MSESLKRTLLISLLILLVIIASPLLFPLIVGGVVASWVNKKKLKQQYKTFLKANDEVVFFCYSDRRNKHAWVEQHILPHLDPNLNVILVQGSDTKSDFDKRCISYMLDNVKNKDCPNLMRISNGKVIDVSLVKDMQRIFDQKLDATLFVEVIHDTLDKLGTSGV